MLFIDINKKLRLLSIKFKALEIKKIETQKILINLINKMENKSKKDRYYILGMQKIV